MPINCDTPIVSSSSPSLPCSALDPLTKPGPTNSTPTTPPPTLIPPSPPALPSISGSSPSPSCSNSETSLPQSLSKRKRSDGSIPKPAKLPKPSLPQSGSADSFENLAFDPYNPHPGMTKEERKLARMIRNRTAAQASRDRKKEHVAELESRVKELEAQVKALSDQAPPASCPRPCCRALDAVAGQLPKSASPSPLEIFQPAPCGIRATPTEAIDPSIIKLEPSTALPSPAFADVADPASAVLTASALPDMELPESLAASAPTTISPAQSEYLSKIRIHVLEEENAQLKGQLELEAKRASQLKYRLLKNHLAAIQPTEPTLPPPQTQLPADIFDLDDELIRLMLKDDEIENMLIGAPGPPTNHQAPEAPVLSLDWASLCPDQAPPLTPTQTTSSINASCSLSPSALQPPCSLFSRLDAFPVTPSPDQHLQSPDRPHPAMTAPQPQPSPNHRLVAREVSPSPQRIGLTAGGLGAEVCQVYGSRSARRLWHTCALGVQPAQWLGAFLGMVMCCLISCWVAWSSRVAQMWTTRRLGRAEGLGSLRGAAGSWMWYKTKTSQPGSLDLRDFSIRKGNLAVGGLMSWIRRMKIDWG